MDISARSGRTGVGDTTEVECKIVRQVATGEEGCGCYMSLQPLYPCSCNEENDHLSPHCEESEAWSHSCSSQVENISTQPGQTVEVK